MRRRMMMNNVPYLPSEYQAVEYLRSDDGEYIDIGLYPNTNWYVEITFMPLTLTRTLFGSYTSQSGRNLLYGIGIASRNHLIAYYFNNTPPEGSSYRMTNTSDYLNRKTTFFFNYPINTVGYNNIDYSGTYIITPIDSVSQNTLTVFAVKKESPWIGSGSAQMYDLKIYANGYDTKISYHFIPCYRKSDNEAGLYDIINHKFYTNQGTGSFIVGPDISLTGGGEILNN